MRSVEQSHLLAVALALGLLSCMWVFNVFNSLVSGERHLFSERSQ
jgi:hypothetical protein